MRRRRKVSMPERRSLCLEPLEERIVFSYCIGGCWDVWPPSNALGAGDDGFVIRNDSEQQEFQVLANDTDRQAALGIAPETGLVDAAPSNAIMIDAASIRPITSIVLADEVAREPLRITEATEAESGTVEVTDDGRSVRYTPAAGFTGIDRFSYTIANAEGETDEANVFVNVVEPLFAMQDWFRVDEGSEANLLDVLQNDSQNVVAFFGSNGAETSSRIVAVGQASHGGELMVSADGTRIVYSPTEDFAGLESFTYTIEDEKGYQAEATVRVQVTTLDDGKSHQVWQEQVAQRLLEEALGRAESHFGRFSSPTYSTNSYWYGNDFRQLRTAGNTMARAASLSGQTIAETSDTLTNSGSFNATLDSDFSTTNIQVEGVDEGDVVKTDGEYLYVLSDWFDNEANSHEHQLIIVNVEDPADPAVVSRYEFEGDVIEQYLNGDRVTVLSESGDDVIVTLLDVTDRSNPTLIYESAIEGKLESSRAIGDFVYVIANTYSSMQLPTIAMVCAADNEGCFYETKQQFVTRVQDSILESVPQIETQNEAGEVIDTRGVFDFSQMLELSDSNTWENFSAVVTFDVASDTGPIASTAFSHGATSHIHVSAQAIYLLEDTQASASNAWGWHGNPNSQTEIHKLAFDNEGSVSWVASGTVKGKVLNQFSVDEHNGFLRVATTTRDWNGENNLYVLKPVGEQLATVGSIEGLAKNERIYSARFVGDRGFVVTFKRVDPLFVFDLSDPTKPTVLGELKVSGYSNYLQLIDESHLLGIGRETNAHGYYEEIQVSLFNISDVDSPSLLHRYSFEGGRRLWSPIMEDLWNLGTHHGVSYFGSRQALVMPVYENGHSRWVRNGQEVNVSMRVLDIDIEDGITALGRVDFDDPFDPHKARAVRIGDTLYSISPEMIKANELRSPENSISELFVGVGATDDSFEMRNTESVPLDVLANDLFAKAEGEARRVVSVRQPRQGGHVILNEADGSVSLRADEDFMGEVNFSYVLGSGRKYRDVANVSVNVRPTWHNSTQPLDVDRDGGVVLLDVLRSVNAIESLGRGAIRELEVKPHAYEALMGGRLRVDVNNDGHFSPLDVLALINHFTNKQQGTSAGGGEGPPASWPVLENTRQQEDARERLTWAGPAPVTELVARDDVIAAVASDIAESQRQETRAHDTVLRLLDADPLTTLGFADA